MNQIEIQDALDLENTIIVDTRSPGEFELDSIPGSISIPIFDNVERKEIGTMFKADKGDAFDLGMEYYSKKLPDLTNAFKRLDKTKTIILYCWRGGIRSKAITQLVDLLGYEAFQLKGGYKTFREYVLNSLLDVRKNFVVLWGNTGSAKTTLIHKLVNALDLEGLAQHRGSLFGGLGLIPRNQKQFETGLLFALQKLPEVVFVEGESRKIGNLVIPENIYKQISSGIQIKIESSIDHRVKNIVNEYFVKEFIIEIIAIIPKLNVRLGSKVVNNLLQLMSEKNYSEVSRILLVDYYDPLYKHTLEGKDFLHTVNSDDVDACVKKLELLIETQYTF